MSEWLVSNVAIASHRLVSLSKVVCTYQTADMDDPVFNAGRQG
ncbi:hypothetical protein [Halomonas sp. QHL1]|nr:hypothetical protein [Halomonas sp. QHL1]